MLLRYDGKAQSKAGSSDESIQSRLRLVSHFWMVHYTTQLSGVVYLIIIASHQSNESLFNTRCKNSGVRSQNPERLSLFDFLLNSGSQILDSPEYKRGENCK